MMSHKDDEFDQFDDDEEMNRNEVNSRLIREKGSSNNDNSSNDIPFCGCLSIRYYQPYFDVETKDIIERLFNSLFFCKREIKFLDLISQKPDAYGPFWISTTLVFCIAVTSHISSWMVAWMTNSEWSYDFQSVVTASSLVYGFSAAVPAAFWLLFRQLTVNLICLYGYSLFIYIPATAICLIPSEAIQWLLLLGSCVSSTVFLLRNLGPIIIQQFPIRQQATILMVILGIVQLSLSITLKFAFY